MMPYIRNGILIGMGRMTNSKKSNQIPGHGKRMIDVERMELLLTDSEPVIHY